MIEFCKNVIDLITHHTFTKGCALGLIYVGLLWLIVELVRLYFYLKNKKQFISVSSGDNGNFLLSYKAIKSHLRIMVNKEFKQVTLDKILINRISEGYSVKLYIQVGGNIELKTLGDNLHDAVKNALDNVVGIPGVFTHIDIVISNLRSDRNASSTKLNPPSVKPIETPAEDTTESSEGKDSVQTETPTPLAEQ
ncbi:MAG: hypothetical protein J6X55_08890 [Victivallales bacterium]|nr:hypothetical protein [Victivallales bacterium]